MCFDFLYNFYVKHFSFYDEFSKMSSKMSKRLYVKYPLFLPDFNESWIFSTDFRKKLKDRMNSAVSLESFRPYFVTDSDFFTALQRTLYWVENILPNGFYVSFGVLQIPKILVLIFKTELNLVKFITSSSSLYESQFFFSFLFFFFYLHLVHLLRHWKHQIIF